MTSILIIGAGFGGIGAAIELKRAGFTDITIVEKGVDVGGVWRENTYPGAACDIPSALYSWSFARNKKWGRRYSPQAEILDYIRETAKDFGVYDAIRFSTEVTKCEWADGKWTVSTNQGDVVADVVVPAVGQLSAPSIPAIPGAEAFTGPSWHSANWRHDVPLAGKKVAVIGSGASAIQFVPAIQPEVAKVTVFQRHAAYILPKPDGKNGPLHRLLIDALAPMAKVERGTIFNITELVNHILIANSVGVKVLKGIFNATLRKDVKDPALRAKLTPDYPFGCKRLLFTNEWFKTMAQPNVDLCTTPITGIEANGVRTSDGELHEADVIVWGTGFKATSFLDGIEVIANGHSLADEWADGASAHLGINVPGFPNFFIIYGPYTNLGGSSIVAMEEAQTRFIVGAVTAITGAGRPLAVRREVADEWEHEMQERLGASVWVRCDNWYREANGKITTNWPGQVREFQDRTSKFELSEFEPA